MVADFSRAEAHPELIGRFVEIAFGCGVVVVCIMVLGFILDRRRRGPPPGSDDPL